MARQFPQPVEDSSNLGYIFLLLYSVAIFIRPQEWDPANVEYFIQYPVARYLLIISFIGYLVSQKPKIWGYQGWLLLGITLFIPISGLRNGVFSTSIDETVDFFLYGLLPLLLYAGLVDSQRKQYWMLFLLAVACAIMLHHGISQDLDPDGYGWSGVRSFKGERIRYLGIFRDPNDMAMFFLINIPILLFLNQTTKNWILSKVFLALCFGMLYGIYLANSRGALVGFMALIFTYSCFKYGKFKSSIIAVVLLPAVYIAMSLFRAIDTEEGSAQGRIDAWYAGFQMLFYRPFFGVGKGEFYGHHGLTAHNSFVLIMAELGVVGYVLWATTIAFTMYMLYKIFSLDKEKYATKPTIIENILYAKCLFYSFVGFLTTAFFLSRCYIIFLYIFVGLACGLYYRMLKETPEIGDILDKKVIGKFMLLSFSSLVVLFFIVRILL